MCLDADGETLKKRSLTKQVRVQEERQRMEVSEDEHSWQVGLQTARSSVK